MNCPKCKGINTDDAKFCGECGQKIPHKSETVKNDSTEQEYVQSKKSKWISILTIIIGISLMAGLLIPYKIVTSSESVPYEATEEYSVREPYSSTETYYEEVPYQEEECEWINPSYNRDISYGPWESGYKTLYCSITNFESEPVRFTYTIVADYDEGFSAEDAEFKYGPRGVTVGPSETKKLEKTFYLNGKAYYYNCYVSAEDIQECNTVTKFKNIAKERIITEYHDIVKTRKVTKMRTDKVYTQVNWLFGVKMPWLAEWRDEGESKDYYSLNEESIE